MTTVNTRNVYRSGLIVCICFNAAIHTLSHRPKSQLKNENNSQISLTQSLLSSKVLRKAPYQTQSPYSLNAEAQKKPDNLFAMLCPVFKDPSEEGYLPLRRRALWPDARYILPAHQQLVNRFEAPKQKKYRKSFREPCRSIPQYPRLL